MSEPQSPAISRVVDLLIEGAGEVFVSNRIGPLRDGVVAIANGQIAHVGSIGDLPDTFALTQDTVRLDARGGLVTPGWVEPHTHIVFAGDRSRELAARAQGKSYLEIAKAGGGIAATMRATREASLEALVDLARPRLDRLLAHGVTTAEVKSGYGLEPASELKILEAIKRLDATHPIDLVPTFLGAHTIPPELRGRRAVYVEQVIGEMIPAVSEAGLAHFCDVFVEEGAFNVEEAERILRAGLDVGLVPKVHADQLSCGGGAELAASVGAISADHLEHISDAGIAALAGSGTVAVLLPGAALFLDQSDRPPARRMIDAGVRVALSTDSNPGSSHTENLELMLTLGVAWLKLSPREALDAVTGQAAAAIGCSDVAGALEPGRPADVVLFDVPTVGHLPYHFGDSHVEWVIKAGRLVYERDTSGPGYSRAPDQIRRISSRLTGPSR